MNNGYHKLRDELEHTELDSIVPGFDRNAAWRELSPRLKKDKSIHWLRYAAALVVLLIIGFIVKMQMGTENSTGTDITVVEQAPKQVAAPAVTKPAPTTQPPPTPHNTIARHKKKAHKKVTRPLQPVDNNPDEIQEHIAQETPAPTEHVAMTDTVEEPVLATQAKPLIKRRKAIHLLDIDNENRQAAMQNRNELQGIPHRIAQWMPGMRQPLNDGNEHNLSSLFKAN